MEQKRIKRIAQLCGMITILFIVGSCRNISPTSPGEIPPLNLSITKLDSLVTGSAGELAAVAFEVDVECELGTVPEYVPVNITVAKGPGQVSVRFDRNQSSFEIKGLYYVILAPGDSSVVVMAVAGVDTARAEIRLHGYTTGSTR